MFEATRNSQDFVGFRTPMLRRDIWSQTSLGSRHPVYQDLCG